MDGSKEQNKPQTEETPSISEAVGLPTQSAPPKKSSLKIFFLLGIAVLIAAVGGTVYLVKTGKIPPQKEVTCTMDAKICPDGSYVSRIPPDCDFTPCPAIISDLTANWKTYTNREWSFSFQYPVTASLLLDTNIKEGTLIGLEGPFGRIFIAALPNTKNLSVENPRQLFDKGFFTGSLGSSEIHQISLSGTKAFLANNCCINDEFQRIAVSEVATIKDSVYYELRAETQIGYSDKEISTLFSQILSTFRFLD